MEGGDRHSEWRPGEAERVVSLVLKIVNTEQVLVVVYGEDGIPVGVFGVRHEDVGPVGVGGIDEI